MSEKKKVGKKAVEPPPDPKDTQPKEAYAVAKWMRKNIPTKRTKFLSHNVEYFTASKAIDALLTSDWAKSPKEGVEPLFPSREAICDYLDIMLRNKFFHRARKIAVSEQELAMRAKKKDKDGDKSKTKKQDKKTSDTESKALIKQDKKSSDAESSKVVSEKEDSKQEGKDLTKKKRKIRLDMHLDQIFLDCNDAYVWIYEPTPVYYWFFGGLMVFGAVAICLFPLWPPSVRLGVYYLSLAAAGFFILIISLVIIRLIVFCLVWGVSFGYHHLWLLPNLTEDVGFFASFWPLYQYEYKQGDKPCKSKGKSKKKYKDSDNEQDGHSESDEKGHSNDNDQGSDSNNRKDRSDTESEGSQKSQTGKDFEIIESEESEPKAVLS